MKIEVKQLNWQPLIKSLAGLVRKKLMSKPAHIYVSDMGFIYCNKVITITHNPNLTQIQIS